MKNNRITLVESISDLRNRLKNIEEAKPGVAGALGDIFSSGMRAVKKLGPRVETAGPNGEKEIWEQIPNTTEYKLTNKLGRDDRVITKDADDLLNYKNDQISRGIDPDTQLGKDVPLNPKLDRKEPTLDVNAALKSAEEQKRAVEQMAKHGRLHLTPSMMKDMVENGLTVEQTLQKYYPDAVAKMNKDPVKANKFWTTLRDKASNGKQVNIKGILIALGLLVLLSQTPKVIDKMKADPTPDQGAKTADDDAVQGAAPGTTIPGEEIDWTYFGYPGLKGSSLTKGKDGVWRTELGQEASDPKLIARIEEFSQMTPEQRKAKIQNDTTFFLYSPGDGGGTAGQADIGMQKPSTPVPGEKW